MSESSMNEEQEHNSAHPQEAASLEQQEAQETQVTAQKKKPLPGALLAARRQELGLTLEHVAEQLKMTPRRISEIEADNIAVVQSKAVFRGFVRAYAKVLRMDPEPLVALLPDDNASGVSLKPIHRRAPDTFAETHVPFASKYNMQTKRMGVAIILVVLLIGGLLVQRMVSGPSQKKMASAQKSSASALASVSAVLPQPEKAVASATNATSASASSPAKDAVKRIDLPPVDLAKQVGAAAAKPETKKSDASDDKKSEAAAQPAAAANGKGALVLKCKEESWVELKNNAGELIASRYIPAGSTVRFSVNEPMQLTIGNAPAVEATLRGRRLNIQVAGDNKVVRLNIK